MRGTRAHQRRLIRADAVNGAIGGLVATAALRAVLVSGVRHGWVDALPYDTLVGGPTRAGRSGWRRYISTAAHLGYGAATGALLGVFGSRTRRGRRDSLLTGAVSGLVVGALGRTANGIAASSSDTKTPESARLRIAKVGAHVAHGAVLGLITRKPARRA